MLLLLLLVAACGEADKVPKGILEKEQMRDVLLDMSLADGYSMSLLETNARPMPDSIRQEHVKVYYGQILALHGLTVKGFMASYRFYEGHPDRLKSVYEMVMTELGRRKAALPEEGTAINGVRYYFMHAKEAVMRGKGDTIIPFLERK